MLSLRSLRQLALSAVRSTLPETWQGGGTLLRPLACSGVQQQAGFASDAFDDRLDEELLGETSVGRYRIPIDAPRTLDDYNRLLTQLLSHKRAYLLRDVFEEMSLNGIRPNRRSYHTGLIACMRMRKLGDAMFFWEEMQRRGLEPDTAAYTAIISACGRCGQLNQAVEYKREMQAKGLEMGRNTYLALLNAFAEAGKLKSARDVFEEMQAAGHPTDEHAFASLISCYRHLNPRSVPADADKQLMGLLDLARQRVHSALVGEGRWSAAMEGKADSVGLVVYNSLLNSLVALGYHQQASEVFRQLREEGLQPDSSTYASIIRSHLVQAVGTHTQPSGVKLTELIESRMRGVDLAPYVKQLEEERLERQRQRRAGGSKGPAGAEDLLEDADVDLSDAEELQPASAAQQAQRAPGHISSDEEGEGGLAPAGVGLMEAGDIEAAEAAGESTQQVAQQEQTAQQQQQQQQRAGTGEAAGSVPSALLTSAAQRARSRIRFDIMAEHIKLEEYYNALHTFQELLDAGLLWGPDVAYELVRASLDLAAALGGGPAQHAEHPEHAKQAQQAKQDLLDVAHTLLEKFEERGLFVDVESGTEMMQLSVRRDVGDLSVAHKLWDLMRRGNRFPRTPVVFKYMRAICEREPHKSPQRIREVCTTILNDPDRSAANMAMKSEAYRRREVFGGPRPPQRDGWAGERRRRR